MTARCIVFVHGLWMPGMAMQYLRKRLHADHGYDGHLFSYASVRGTIDENAALLEDFVGEQPGEAPHIVAHSLGGIVALRMLAREPALEVGRLVCLGSPFTGSRAGLGLSGQRWGRAIVGRSLAGAVIDEPATAWAGNATAAHEIGVIAGTQAVGGGRMVARFDEPNDGTVAVSETRLPGIRDHVCMPVSHTGLILSAGVAAQVAAFLANGRFDVVDR